MHEIRIVEVINGSIGQKERERKNVKMSMYQHWDMDSFAPKHTMFYTYPRLFNHNRA
ncbi:hypothetical protein G8V07_12565 [Clostridium botulinum D/C]|uniref:hypothetical protein n=1 Tax=Clostridium botulinum TaxID=1491 RepID=UPI001E325BD7|nr:hypothetical protein [Clostridium botulinum]MCD3321142.1 hypothetical protein [Clostridium botulinum D/C]MCD3324582.1 hypothetical protein [Clostridium botulinum D/C]MCD3326852.1 hypothetical protein [Clostridium botulinum D/C]